MSEPQELEKLQRKGIRKLCQECGSTTRPPSQPGREEVARAILKSREFSDTRIEYFKTHDLGVWIEACKAADAIRDLYALTKGTETGAVTGEPVYCTRDGADFCNAVSDKARCSICPAFPSRNSTDE